MENQYKRDTNAADNAYKNKNVVSNRESGVSTTLVVLGAVTLLAVGAYLYHIYAPETNPVDIDHAAGTSYVTPADAINPVSRNRARTRVDIRDPDTSRQKNTQDIAPSLSTAR